MNLKFNGDQDLIRSIEEGSRLLLSEKKQDGTAAMTFSLEKVMKARDRRPIIFNAVLTHGVL